MAKRGEIARERAKDIICNAFGKDFVTVQDKKIYVMAKDEGGEKVQFAITLTMPKNPIDTGNTYVNKNDWTGTEGPTVAERGARSAINLVSEISDEDKEKIDELMKTLGIVD